MFVSVFVPSLGGCPSHPDVFFGWEDEMRVKLRVMTATTTKTNLTKKKLLILLADPG